MAIAFEAGADCGNNGGGTGRTVAYTVGSGANRLLAVAIWGDVSGGTDLITDVSYASVSMTLADKNNVTSGRWNYLYYLLNPTSGSNNIVVSCSGAGFIGVNAADYTGVGSYDATNKGTGTSSANASVTTVADNCWAICAGYSNSNIQASTGSTERARSGAFGNGILCDSNGAITPAGSYSMEITGAVASSIVVASFAPPGAGGGGISIPVVVHHRKQQQMA